MLHSSEYTEASPPLFLHECRSHVYRAIVAWILSKKRPKEVKDMGMELLKCSSILPWRQHPAHKSQSLQRICDIALFH